MSIKLVKEDYVTDISGNKDTSRLFFKYDVSNRTDDTAEVWFSQSAESGNIYAAYVRLPEILNKFFEAYVNVPIDGPYYPNNIEISIKPISINDLKLLLSYKDLVDRIYDLSNEIMKVFSSGKIYHNFYDKHDTAN